VKAADMFVYFGTHSSGPGKGFSLAHFDTETGKLSKPQFLIESKEPAFFIIAPDGNHLYTCNSGAPGAVTSYAIDRATGQLKLLNEKAAGGGDPSFISLDRTGKFVLNANYQGGNIAVHAIQPDGSFGERTAFIQHTGSSINPQRQTKPYAHSIITDPTNRFALAADLGIDKFFVYRFNEKDGTLSPHDPPFVTVKPGSGPRHARFHPNGKWVYLITEIASTTVGYNWDSERGTLAEFQTVSTLPDGFTGTSTCSELEIHPNGKFLYGSNRGHDSIAVFAIDQANGKLSLVQIVDSAGKTPRNFAFDPSAKWMICTNHGSNNAVVFRVDENSGRLTQVGDPVEVPSPFCERFLPVKP
jgi:6-phosphogluconolactonase